MAQAHKGRVVSIFFGIDDLAITEVDNKNLISQCVSSYILSPEEKAASFDEIDKTKLAAILQNLLKSNNIETEEVIVSLPIRNIILRSFFMPVMPKDELDTAIEYESKKYIPFKLEDLTTDYQLFKVKEDKVSRLRILIVGIKNELLENYLFALEESNLKIKHIEPSPVSLLRALISKMKISRQQTLAVVEVNRKGGNIIISDNAIPTFINDFKFSLGASDEPQMQNEVLMVKLANDIRLSIDYYHRHTPKAKISSIVLCPDEIPEEVIEGLKKEIDIPVIPIVAKEILDLEDTVRMGLLYAYGAALRDYVQLEVSIDLYKKVVEVAKSKLEAGFLFKRLTPQQIRKLIQTGIIAASLLFVFFLFNLRQIWSLQLQLKKMSQKQIEVKPDLRSLTKKELDNTLLNLRKKLKFFSGLKKEKTLTPLIDILPQLLPEGVWLRNLTFNAGIEGNVKELNISGGCYIEDQSMQINIINQFISNLKKQSLFAKEFKNIDINSISQQTEDNWLFTNFEVSCR